MDTQTLWRGGEECFEHFGAVAEEAISVTIEEGSPPAHFRETLWPREGMRQAAILRLLGQSRSSEAGRMRAQIWHLRHYVEMRRSRNSILRDALALKATQFRWSYRVVQSTYPASPCIAMLRSLVEST